MRQRKSLDLRRWLIGLLTGLVLIIAISSIIPRMPFMGGSDFRAYWSASYLLAHSEDFSDPELLLAIEREHTGWRRDYAVMTWNPPWLLALLLPYTLVSFVQATKLWLFTNIGLIYTGSVLVWRVYARREATQRRWAIAPLVAFTFSPVLTILMMGQVNSLVFLGLAIFLYFEQRNRQFKAGMGLVLMLVKPHLVYITAPLILLTAIVKRQWRVLIGMGITLLILMFIVFLLHPTFLVDYGRSIAGGRLLRWATPTLGGILAETFGWNWGKLVGVVILPLAVILWWRKREQFDISSLVNVTLLVSVITAPFGWGYDAVVLFVRNVRYASLIGERGSVSVIKLIVVYHSVRNLLSVIGLQYHRTPITDSESCQSRAYPDNVQYLPGGGQCPIQSTPAKR